MNPELEQLKREIAEIKQQLDQFIKPGKYVFRRKVEFANGSLYLGDIPANGAANFLPVGWSVNQTSPGFYQITHNLGTTKYVVTTGPFLNGNSDLPSVITYTRSANSFVIESLSSGSDASRDFFFMLMTYN